MSGSATARLNDASFELRPLSQLVVLPGVACEIEAASEAVVELLSLLSMTAEAATSE